MWYEGLDVLELAELLRYETEPIVVGEAFLLEEDLELLHGWILEPNWYKTEIISWGSGSVSSKTTRHQRLVPPIDWVPDTHPEPEPEPESEEPSNEEPTPEEPVPEEGE